MLARELKDLLANVPDTANIVIDCKGMIGGADQFDQVTLLQGEEIATLATDEMGLDLDEAADFVVDTDYVLQIFN